MNKNSSFSVTDAIVARQSVRTFLPDPVDPQVVSEILELAARAPSNGNLQPWIVHAVTGDVMRTIGDKISRRIAQGVLREEGAMNVYPPKLWEPYKGRRHAAGTERYAALGFFDKDPAGLQSLTDMNVHFFNAPIGLFFGLTGRMERHQWVDLGMYMQNVMLLAVERGLDTCPQAFWTNWIGVVRQTLGLGDDLAVVAGMSLGRRDPEHPINQYRTERAALESFASFHGF